MVSVQISLTAAFGVKGHERGGPTYLLSRWQNVLRLVVAPTHGCYSRQQYFVEVVVVAVLWLSLIHI